MSSPLLPPERMALTVAKAQIKRGENPSPNITAVLIMALARLVDKLADEETQLQAIADAWERWQYLNDRSANGDEIHEAWLTHLALMDAFIGGYEVVDDDIEPGPGLAEALTQADEIDALTEEDNDE